MSERRDEPACPRCGSTMVRRVRGSDGAAFWGCSRFPECGGAREVAAIELPEPVKQPEPACPRQPRRPTRSRSNDSGRPPLPARRLGQNSSAVANKIESGSGEPALRS